MLAMALALGGFVGVGGIGGCERRLFDPDTLYTSPDPAQPWEPPSAVAQSEPWASPSSLARSAPTATAVAGFAEVMPSSGELVSLASLIDFALRNNPATRLEWERARASHADVGIAESRYFPTLNARAFGGTSQQGLASTDGREIIRGPVLGGAMEMNWVLLDFGRRDAASAAAAQSLVAANYRFNRTLQSVVYEVQRTYFALDAKTALEETARQNLETALTQADAIEERLGAGLATRPDHLLAQQRLTRARFDLEAARSDTINARAALARAVGLPADADLRIDSLQDLPLPEGLEDGVDLMVQESLANRPDIQARVAEVRAAAQRVREAEAAFAPVVSFDGAVGGAIQDYRVTNQPGAPFPPLDRRYTGSMPSYFLGLRATWLLFDGWERESALRRAIAERRAAAAALDSLRLDVTNEVWAAYFDFRAARVQLEFGEALLRSSQDAYDSVFEAYLQGLRTVTDLLQAESDLDSARSTLVRTRADLLAASVRLAYAMGATGA